MNKRGLLVPFFYLSQNECAAPGTSSINTYLSMLVNSSQSKAVIYSDQLNCRLTCFGTLLFQQINQQIVFSPSTINYADN